MTERGTRSSRAGLPTDADAQEAAIEAFRRELDEGMLASATLADGSAEVVRELPLDADLVVLRRPIAGG